MTASVASIREQVSHHVRALLACHGHEDPRQQWPVPMAILEARHSPVYRKISGRSSWLEEDLNRIAAPFGETQSGLFGFDAPHVGEPASARARVLSADGLAVFSSGDAAASDIVGAVQALTLDVSQPQQGGVAVFDDNPDVVDAIVDGLGLRGMHAQAFYNKTDLLNDQRRYDLYILDWYSGADTTTEDLVEHLKGGHAPDADIVILTGQINRGTVESDLARLIRTHGVVAETKPIRLGLLLAKLGRA